MKTNGELTASRPERTVEKNVDVRTGQLLRMLDSIATLFSVNAYGSYLLPPNLEVPK